MEFYKELAPFAKRIMKVNSVNPKQFSIGQIQPIIDDLMDFLYINREAGSKAKKKHVISKSLLENFTQEFESQVRVQKDNEVIPMNIRTNFAFCLPRSKKHFWTQDIEDFFKPIETLGRDALAHFRAQIDSNPDNLVKLNVRPLKSLEETRMRLILALYLAMHVERQAVRSGTSSINDNDFVDHMKTLTASLFFHVWNWCKVINPTFIIPISTPIVKINYGDVHGEYILPLSPTLALFVASDNFSSHITNSFIFDERDESDINYEIVGGNSVLFDDPEREGQQRFIIQTGETSYTVYHSNARSEEPKEKILNFTHEYFFKLAERLKEIFPFHVRPTK